MRVLFEFSSIDWIVLLLIIGMLGVGLVLTLGNRLLGLSWSDMLAQLMLNLVHTVGWLLAAVAVLAVAHGVVGGQIPPSWRPG